MGGSSTTPPNFKAMRILESNKKVARKERQALLHRRNKREVQIASELAQLGAVLLPQLKTTDRILADESSISKFSATVVVKFLRWWRLREGSRGVVEGFESELHSYSHEFEPKGRHKKEDIRLSRQCSLRQSQVNLLYCSTKSNI